MQKEISLFQLGNQGYLFKALSVEFEICCIIGLKWKETCFWDNEACVDWYDVFRFPIMYFRDSPVVAQVFLFKSESQGRR